MFAWSSSFNKFTYFFPYFFVVIVELHRNNVSYFSFLFLFKTVNFWNSLRNRHFSVSRMNFNLDFMTSNLKLYHKKDKVLFFIFLSWQKFRWVHRFLLYFLIILTDRMIIYELLLELSLTLTNFHSFDSFLEPFYFG